MTWQNGEVIFYFHFLFLFSFIQLNHYYEDKVWERSHVKEDKREFNCDQQVEMGSDSFQLHTKGFMRRRRKWEYQKEIKIKSAAYL